MGFPYDMTGQIRRTGQKNDLLIMGRQTGLQKMGHSNYQIGPNQSKLDQIRDTYYQNQHHFIQYILKTVSERQDMARFGSS